MNDRRLTGQGSFLKLLSLAVIFFAGFTLTLSAFAENSVKGNERKGKYLFKNRCKQCHTPDKGQGEVEVTPSLYTKKQWERFFKRNKHKRKKDISDLFTEEELVHIRTFVINHAADSDQPETCG